MDSLSRRFVAALGRHSRGSPMALATVAAAVASVACSDLSRDPLEPHAPSLGRATNATAAGFSDEFEVFDLSRWSKEDHPLGRGFFRTGNVVEGPGNVALVLRAGTYDGGEIRSLDQFGYGTYTIRMQTPRAPGSISAFFLYQGRFRSDEIDIEVYNDGTRRVLLTTWVRGRQTNNVTKTLPFDPAAAMHEYTIDWTSESVRFSVDGAPFHSFTSKVPRNAMHLMANAWWPTWLSGPTPQTDAPVVIDRIDVTPR